MDLVSTVRKEGSRGGRDNFSWEDVKANAHRQNYLGHSVMAPVGRWQQGRDLNWYSKGDEKDPQAETEARKEEMRKIKEAEEDAMARALGQDPPSRANPNLIDVGNASTERRLTGSGDNKKPSHRTPQDRRERPRSRERRREGIRRDERHERHGRRHRHRSRLRSRSPSRSHHPDRERSYSRSPRRRPIREDREDRERYRSRAEDERRRHRG